MKKETKEVQSTKNVQSTKAKMYVNIPKDASSKESKQFRGKRRRILFNCTDAIISASLKKNEKELQKEIKSFLQMYKAQYVLNDMSVASLYIGANDSKKDDLKRMIALVQKSLAKKK